MARNPRVGITTGDPGSIGPEVLLRALSDQKLAAHFILFGSRKVLLHHSSVLKLPFDESRIQLIDIDNVSEPYFGPYPELAGAASIEYLETAFEYYREGKIDAVVTGPIQKESWHLNGYTYPGQTEFCAELSGSTDYLMMMVGRIFRIALLSTHCSMQEALQRVRRQNILAKIRLIDSEWRKLGFDNPRIGCAALNPHAGENGAFGNEEYLEITPALRQLRAEGIAVDGPLAPEIIFRVAAEEKKWDVIFAMYHDQAMIPLKLLEFHSSANVTLGLPLIRTSPDHGTAFDIAGKGIANHGSMLFALELAVDWTKRKLSL